MGDICDTNDIERFRRSREGKAHLRGICDSLNGRTITDVTFCNKVHRVDIVLHLDNGANFIVCQPSLEVEALRDQFEAVLEREYQKDYPERKTD